MKKIDSIISAAGIALFAFVIWKIGWVNILRQLMSLRFAFLVLFGLSLLRLALQTYAWATALRAEGIPKSPIELIGIRLASQSMGYLSVLGPAISEPMKIRLLRDAQLKSTAATLADSSVYGFTSALVGIAGCVCAGLMMVHSGQIAGMVALAVLFTIGLFLIARRTSLLAPLVRALAFRCPAWLRKGEQIEIAIRQFGRRHKASVCRMFWLDLFCQALIAAEVVAVFWVLSIPLHAVTVLALEAASKAVKMLAGWMPARIGADESGTVAAFAAFGLPCSSGLALALVRRARDLLTCVLGLGWLLWTMKRSGERIRLREGIHLRAAP